MKVLDRLQMAQTYNFDKEEVISALEKNRAAHHQIFLEALDGYRDTAITLFKEKISEVKAGKIIDRYVHLEQPEDHTRDYDRIIALLKMSIGNTVELTEQQFSNYIQDDWDWKHNFLSSNAFYSATAQTLLASE